MGLLSNRQLGDLVYCLAEINHIRPDVAYYVKQALIQQKLTHDRLCARHGIELDTPAIGPGAEDRWVVDSGKLLGPG